MTPATVAIQPQDLGIGRLFWAVRDAVIVAAPQHGQIVLWNPAAEQLLGYAAAEVVGQPIERIIPEPLRARHQAGLARFHATGHGTIIDAQAPVEVPALHRSGAEVWVELTLSRLDGPDEASYVLALLRDVTARRQAEAERQASAERLRLALAGARMGTWDWDLRTNTLVVSPTTEALYGYVPGTGPSTAEGFEQTLHPDDRELVPHAMAAALRTDDLALEYRVVWLDGSLHWLGLTGRTVRDEVGRPVRLLGVVADLTDRKRAEAERAARAEAEAALRLRDEFFSVAAHELKTPITSLRGFAELLLKEFERAEGPDPERVQRALRTIDQQSVTLTRLVGQLLDAARIGAGRLALECEPTDLVALVRRAVAAAQARTQRHALQVAAPTSLAAQLDPLRIEQVLANLLDNAIKYSPAGGRIDVRVGLADRSIVRVTVRDRGLGIPPESRARIFEHSYQAHAQSRPSGLGLGLYISRQIIELHGGRITAQFPTDGGTRLVVELPLHPASATGAVA
jgi:PAS domain S-box-containing protein